MAVLDDRIATAELEDCWVLDEIQRMICVRASAVGMSIVPVEFGLNATVIEKLGLLRDRVYSLAPEFIDMDYPYWNKSWTEFPRKFTTSWQSGQEDVLARDEEHAINELPQFGSSFDDASIALYRRFLSNLVYWLRKFRYVQSKLSYWDLTYRRYWDWTKSWDWTAWAETTSASCTPGGTVTGVSDGALRGGREGVVWRTGPRVVPAAGLGVTWQEDGFMRKNWHYKDSVSDPRPLSEYTEGEHILDVRNVPHALTTINPSCYEAEVLWFIVPSTSQPGLHHGRMQNDTNAWTVVQKEPWTIHRWGPNNEYSAQEYHPVDQTGEGVDTQREVCAGAEKTTKTETTVYSPSGSTKHTVRTNWTDTGDRSAVAEDTTETVQTRTVEFNSKTVIQDVFQDFGLVTMDATTKPCFSAGTVGPHGSVSYTVCDQTTLPLPSYPFSWSYVGDDTYCFGIFQQSNVTMNGNTVWYPVLDFGDFSIPDPDAQGD